MVAPGTGLGEAFLIYDGTRYRAFPSEGGHASFAPRDELEAGLLAYLKRRFDHVSVERVCSGPGLLHLYQYLRDSDSARVTRNGPRPGRRGARAGADWRSRAATNPDPLSHAALARFVSILGAEAGTLPSRC